MRSLAFQLAVVLAAHGVAQTPAQLKQELRAKEAAAKQDAEALFAVGKWADENGLGAEARRIYQNVLKIAPEHEGANLALGNELVAGKWLTAKDAEAERKKALDAEFKAKGWVQVDGVWVAKEHAADAKKGIFHHEGGIVSKEEMLALMGGMVRHPVTGELIDKSHLAEAEARKFPIGTEGRWVEEKEADRFHADRERPWVFRSDHCTLLSTLPVAKLELVKNFADRGVEHVLPIFGLATVAPAHRPTVVIASTEDEFRGFGTSLGDETSSYGAFLATDDGRARVRVPYQGEVRPAVCLWHKEWGEFYLRHAAALAYVGGLCAGARAEVPLWFLHAAAGYASRFENLKDASWFGEQHQQKGGVKELKGWFNSFAINGEMESKQIDYNIYQAGLLISFAATGGDDKATKALQEVTAAFADGKSQAIDKSIDKLKTLLLGKEDEIRRHLQTVIAKGKGQR
jgi:hypothetical protein